MSNLQSETTQNNQHQNSFHHQVHHDPIPPPIDSELSPSSSSVLHSSKDEDSISLLLLQLEAPLTNPSQASALTTLKRSPANPSRRHASKQQHREVIQLTKSTRLYHVGERFMRLATEDQPCALKLYFKVHDISQDRSFLLLGTTTGLYFADLNESSPALWHLWCDVEIHQLSRSPSQTEDDQSRLVALVKSQGSVGVRPEFELWSWCVDDLIKLLQWRILNLNVSPLSLSTKSSISSPSIMFKSARSLVAPTYFPSPSVSSPTPTPAFEFPASSRRSAPPTATSPSIELVSLIEPTRLSRPQNISIDLGDNVKMGRLRGFTMSGDRIALRSDSKVVILRKSFDAQNLAWKVVRVIEVNKVLSTNFVNDEKILLFTSTSAYLLDLHATSNSPTRIEFDERSIASKEASPKVAYTNLKSHLTSSFSGLRNQAKIIAASDTDCYTKLGDGLSVLSNAAQNFSAESLTNTNSRSGMGEEAGVWVGAEEIKEIQFEVKSDVQKLWIVSHGKQSKLIWSPFISSTHFSSHFNSPAGSIQLDCDIIFTWTLPSPMLNVSYILRELFDARDEKSSLRRRFSIILVAFSSHGFEVKETIISLTVVSYRTMEGLSDKKIRLDVEDEKHDQVKHEFNNGIGFLCYGYTGIGEVVEKKVLFFSRTTVGDYEIKYIA